MAASPLTGPFKKVLAQLLGITAAHSSRELSQPFFWQIWQANDQAAGSLRRFLFPHRLRSMNRWNRLQGPELRKVQT